MKSFRTLLIWLRHFWPAAPALAVAALLAWLLWGLSLWVSVMVPVAAGIMVFLLLGLASGLAGR